MVKRKKQGGDIMAAHETVCRLAMQQAYAATAFPTDDGMLCWGWSGWRG
jgi:hypothetical protein